MSIAPICAISIFIQHFFWCYILLGVQRFSNTPEPQPHKLRSCIVPSISKRSNPLALPILALATLLSVQIAAASPVTFTDGTFVSTDWSAAKTADTTAGQTAFFTAIQESAGGNPGAYRMTTLDWAYDGTSASQGFRVAALDSNAIYNPSVSGAIGSLSFSLDGVINNRATHSAVGERLVIYQSGTYYYSTESLLTGGFGIWTTDSSSGLGGSDFTTLPGTGHPDFSATGAPIEFGYSLETFSTPADASAAEDGFFYGLGTDNFSVTVNSAPAPEPATLSLFCLAGFTLLFTQNRGRWSRRQSDASCGSEVSQ